MARSSMKLELETTARELIKVNTSVIKYGHLRKRSSNTLFENWPFRFVVLLKDALHVYKDENSRNPSSLLDFREYNQVMETTSKPYDCCFTVFRESQAGSASSRNKTFSCVWETELKEWIAALRMAIKPEIIKRENAMFGEVYRDEHEYSAIGDIRIRHEIVTREIPGAEKNTRRLNCSSLTIDSKVSSEPPPRPSVPPQPRPFSGSVSSGRYQSTPRRSPPKPPQDVLPYDPTSDLVIKARLFEVNADYSENKHTYDQIDFVCDDGSMFESIYNAYKFTPPSGESSLVADCVITDPLPDRDRCITLLKSTREPGAYLVRNSRQGKQRVLAILSERGEVVEYIIYEEGSKITINHSSYFSSLEELLDYYSTTQLTKSTGEHLKKGIHLVVRSRKLKV